MNCWLKILRATLPLVSIGLSLPIAAALETTLQGWENYRFGMTPDQTRALSGTSWSDLKSLPDGSIQYMIGLTTVRIEGHDFHIGVYFDKDQKLKSIGLAEVATARPSSQCEREFQDLLRSFEARYGIFSPQLKPDDVTRPNSIEWRPLPGGNSTYYVLTAGGHSVIGGHGEIGYLAAAWREFGRAWVRLQITTNGDGACEFRITFQQD